MSEDLKLVFEDYSNQGLPDYFDKITKPGLIDQVAVEELLLNLPRDRYRSFNYFRLLMQQRVYDFDDIKTIIMIVKRINAVNRGKVYDAIKKRVSRGEKDEAYWAETLMANSWQLLLSAIKPPASLALRGSDDPSYYRDEVLEEALIDLGHRV